MIVVVILVIRAQALQETSITTIQIGITISQGLGPSFQIDLLRRLVLLIQIGITISQGLGPSFQIDLLKTGRIACRAKIHS